MMSVFFTFQSHVTLSVLCSCVCCGVLSDGSISCVSSPAGTRDRHGRALLMVCTWSSVWSNPGCDQAELLRLLLYYTSTLRFDPLPLFHCPVLGALPLIALLVWSRKEMLALGVTVLVDARRAAPVPSLFSALRCLQVSHCETGNHCMSI